MSLLLPLAPPMGSTAAAARQPSLANGASGLLRDLLANPLVYGEPVGRASFAPKDGLKEVLPGPPSPPRTLLKLEPARPAVNGDSAAASDDDEGMSAVKEVIQEERRVVAGPSTPPHLRKQTSPPPPTHTKEKAPAPPHVSESESDSAPPTPTKKANGLIPKKANGHVPPPASSAVASGSSSSSSLRLPNGEKALLGPIPDTELHFPSFLDGRKRGAAGLYNPSMACYANATMQVMMHTPPFIIEAERHVEETCPLSKHTPGKRYCLLCIMRDMMDEHWRKPNKAYSPRLVHNHLNIIKKGFNKNRQEDTHEFFRFACDALQNSALAEETQHLPEGVKLSEAVKHTTWVHRIWGGRVRSRVVCSKCSKPSDTFDHFLDLSLDCAPAKKTLSAMLAGFVKEDKLEGDNKYHCESCKGKANATKSFRIAEAPPVLTLHLKRFRMNYNSWNGKARADKYNQHIGFDEYIDIAPYMVERKAGAPSTKYRLFGVTCHRGAELRYGHYTAYVRAPNGNWYQADDEDMSPVRLGDIKNDKTAYLLSYIRIPAGEDIPRPNGLANGSGANGVNGHANGLVNGDGGKRKRTEEDEEDEMRRPAPSRLGAAGAAKEMLARNGGGPQAIPRRVQPVTTPATPLFPSKLDTPLKPTGQAPPSPPASDRTARSDDEEENEAGPSRAFGAEMRDTTSIRAPIPQSQFYGKPSPIPRPRHPGPDSPRGKNRKKDRHRGGKKGNSMPYNLPGVGGFRGKSRGMLGNMKGKR